MILISALFWGALVVFPEPLRHATLSVIRFPFTVLRLGAGALVTLPRLPGLTREQAGLREELLQRQLENATLREALRQAQQAQRLLEAASAPQGVVAAIIGRSTIPTQQTILLNRGAQDSLSLESVIVDTEGVVGRAVEVQPRACLVMLLTDPESRVAALVERSRETGLLVGRGLGQCELLYLEVHADIEVGDRILTAGLGGVFPKGLLLGTVVRVTRDEEAGIASAIVQPAARLGRLEDVLCLPAAPTAAQ